MTSKFFLIFLLLFLKSGFLYAGFDVKIQGVFPGAEGKTIRLFEYSDLITFRQKQIDSKVVDETGNFEFNLVIYEPQYVSFRIDHARNGMYIEPGNTYEIEFSHLDFDAINDRRSLYIDPINIPFEIRNMPPDCINSLIDSLDRMFDEFILENFSMSNYGRMGPLLVQFRELTDSVFTGIDKKYFKDYYDYKFGRFYNITNSKPAYNLALEYFFDMDVLYKNMEYMDYFNSYFENFVINGSRNIRLYDIEFTVNELGSYTALMDSLGKDSVLRNEVLREMVLLKSMDKLYNHRDFSKNNMSAILEEVANNSKFPAHRTIAENILWAKNHLTFGSDAPDFLLVGGKGEEISLSDFEGKYLYLSFFTTWCVPCNAELPVIETLYSEYADIVEFVSVSVDRHTTPYYDYLRKNDFSWQIFHFNDNFDMLDDYNVRSYPVFVLISPDGKIMNYPSLYPSIAIQGYFDNLRRIHQSTQRQEERQRQLRLLNPE